MSIYMVKTIKEEKLKWVLPVVKKEIKLKDVTKVCPYGKRSLERWVALYKKLGASIPKCIRTLCKIE